MYIRPHGGNVGFGTFFSFDLGVNQTLLGGNVGGFIDYDGAPGVGNAVGSAKCCIRVSSYESDTFDSWTQAFFRETNYILKFNMTDNDVKLTNVVVSENDADTFTTQVEDEFFVEAYQCDNFARVTTPLAIQQNEQLIVCLKPSHPDNLDVVHITNFNLAISAGVINTDGYINYDAVTFGTTTWFTNTPLTTVKTQGKIIMIIAPVIAQFFIQGYTTIDVTGNAFLEFDSGKHAAPVSTFYRMTAGLDVEVETGCFSLLLKTVRAMF